MKSIQLFFYLLLTFTVGAQNAQQEINDQVWKPFLKAFNDNDTKAFMAVHSKEVVRSSRDDKQILDWDEYSAQQEKSDKADKIAGRKRTLELRFTERIANKDRAIDVGVYKTSYLKPDGTSRSFYGRFHVVMRKEEGIWKILVDTDSSEKNTISEKEYLAASAME
jgi:ketosteroid isomerase-like protein